MSDPETSVEGSCLPFSALGRPAPTKLDPSLFAVTNPPTLHTGKAESEWVGRLLLHLSAQGGAWHGVPWRKLRNDYVHYDAPSREKLKADRQLPDLDAVSDDEVIILGGGKPIAQQRTEELLIGVRDMVRKDLVATVTVGDEDFLLPTDRLLTCAVTSDNPMTAERHIDPFGRLGLHKPA